jgi:hypothetical protein
MSHLEIEMLLYLLVLVQETLEIEMLVYLLVLVQETLMVHRPWEH